MFRFKTFTLAAIYAAFVLFSLTSYGNGFHIVDMYPSYGGYEDDSGYLYNTAYVKTSEPYYGIAWYVNDVLVSNPSGDGQKTEAYFSPNSSDYPGSVTGKKYQIKATAWSLPDAEGHYQSDTKSYDVMVYSAMSKTEVLTTPKKHTDVSGYIALNRHYYSHPDVVMVYSVSANYSGDEDESYFVTTEYKNTIWDFWGPGAHKQEPPWDQQQGPSKTLSKNDRSFSDSGSISNSLVGGAEPDGEYLCGAYVRLVVSANRRQDHYHFEPSHTFRLGFGAVE